MSKQDPKKGGIYLSTCAAWTIGLLVVALLVAEGLLVGLLGKPTCDIVPVPEETTAPSKPTDPVPTTPDPDTGDEIWKNSRLPENLIPLHYNLNLRPDLEIDPVTKKYWFYGSSSVEYMCGTATEYIVIHTRDIDYTTVEWTLKDDAGEDVDIKDTLFYTANSYLVVQTSKPCEEGRNYTFEGQNFKGELGDDLDGLYRSEYYDEDGNLRVIATSQMETTGARMTFPCFDEPSFKATFAVTLRHKPEYVAVSNMPVASSMQYSETDGSLWNETVFDVTPIMSTYLLALTVTDFLSKEAFTADGIQTKIYARSTPVLNGEVTYAADVSPQILDELANHLSVPYPLPKSDQMCVPDFGAGAMENWGLVLYREIYLLYDEQISSVYNKRSVTSVIAHELSHQWFGNLVTADYWNEIWLNEGFATYFTYIGAGGVTPEWKWDEMFIIDDLQVALSYDSYSSSHALVHPQGYFSDISYSKGASFLRMVNGFLGESTFTNALTNYLNKLKFSSATHDMLFNEWIKQAEADGVTETIPYDLQTIFETWTLQMGYPLITVTRKSGNELTLSQEYFLVTPGDTPDLNDSPGSQEYRYKWYVPITYKSSNEITEPNVTSQWMEPDSDLTITFNGDFALINVDAVGFYRVLYDNETWMEMAKQLQNDHTVVSSKNRAQLMNDAFEISRSEKLDIVYALELTRYLEKERDYVPWETFTDAVDYFDKMFAGSALYGDYTKYVLSLVVPGLYDHYTWNDTDTSDAVLVSRMARGMGIEIACYNGHPDCISTASSTYKNWMNNPTALVSATYRTYVYCTAIAAGGVEEWDFAWNQYLATDSAQHKTSLRYGMSCSKDPWIINRYIEYSLDSNNVRNQDASSTMSYIGGHEHSKYVAWAFAMNNWNRMLNTVGSSATSSLLSATRRRFSTTFDIQLIDDLASIAGPLWKGTFASYKSSVQTNMKWRALNEPKVVEWLGLDPGLVTPTSSFVVMDPVSVMRPEHPSSRKERVFSKQQY